MLLSAIKSKFMYFRPNPAKQPSEINIGESPRGNVYE